MASRFPTRLLLECARGLLDGDGSISNFKHRPTKRTYPKYWYERFRVEFNSASRAHLLWLRRRLENYAADQGTLAITAPKNGRHEYCTLRYGKAASIRLLPLLYQNTAVPRLERKWKIWDDYRRRHCAEGGT